MFQGEGPSDDDVRKPVLPAFLEVEPGTFKPLEQCTGHEIRTTVLSMTMQARALIEEAKLLDRYGQDRPD
jgi:hypothetical protein